jgi:hypothetical protein
MCVNSRAEKGKVLMHTADKIKCLVLFVSANYVEEKVAYTESNAVGYGNKSTGHDVVWVEAAYGSYAQ